VSYPSLGVLEEGLHPAIDALREGVATFEHETGEPCDARKTGLVSVISKLAPEFECAIITCG
jgi:hypothetical protein